MEEESVTTEQVMKTKFGDGYPYYKTLQEIHDSKGVQARLPFIIPFN